MGSLVGALRKSADEWLEDDAMRIGAALAFYSVLSLAPLVILALAIAALVFGETAARQHLIAEVGGLVGKEGSDAVQAMIEHAQKANAGLVSSVLGMGTLLFGASGVFGELQSALNTIWEVTPAQEGGIWGTVRRRVVSIGMVLAVGFLLLVSLLASTVLAALGKFWGGVLPLPEFFLHAINFVISTGGTALLFALIFRYLPAARTSWRTVWTGAVLTALLFSLGKAAIGMYLGKAAVGSAYGAAGSLVVMLVWVYYSALIFLYGCEFTHALAQPATAASPSPPQ